MRGPVETTSRRPVAVAVAALSVVAWASPAGAVVAHRPGQTQAVYERYLDHVMGETPGALEEVVRLHGETSFLAFEQAWRAGASGNQRRMLERAERAVELDPENHDARALLARTYFQLADYGREPDLDLLARAVAHAEPLVDAGRADPEVSDRLAAHHARAARRADARRDGAGSLRHRRRQREVLSAWADSRGDRLAWRRLAELSRELGDEEGEAEALAAELRRQPDNLIIVQGLAELLQRLGRCEEVVSLLRDVAGRPSLDVYAAISVNVYLGECAHAVGLPELAEAALRRALSHDPTNVEVAVGLADVAWSRGDTAAALAVLDDVGSRVTRRAGYLEHRARWEAAHGRLADARATARRALQVATDAGNAEARDLADLHLLLADLAMDAGDTEAAVEAARLALEVEPGHDTAAVLLAEYMWRQGKREDARRHLDRWEVSGSASLTFLERRARWFGVRGLVREAASDAQRALAAARAAAGIPARRLAIVERALALLMLQVGRPDLAEATLRSAPERAFVDGDARLLLADALAAQGRADAAREILDELTEARSGTAPTWGRRVQWEIEHGWVDEAVTHARRALELARSADPGDGLLLARYEGLLGRALVAARQPDEAVTLSRSALARVPRPPVEGFRTLARAHELAGDLQAAAGTLERAASLHGDAVGLEIEHGRLLLLAGRTEEGLAKLSGLVNEHRNDAWVHRRVAIALDDGGAAAAARDAAEAAVQRFPHDVSLLLLLGSLHERAGRLGAAEAAFQSALEVEPHSATAQNYLAYTWGERGVKLAQAEELVRSALEAMPHEPAYLDTLGWILFKRGRVEAAEEQLREAVRRSRDPVIVMHLGTLRETLGHRDEALELYREALRFGLDEDVDRVRAEVERADRAAAAGP